MKKHITLYIFAGITLFFVLIAGLVATLFSEFGNNIIKSEIQKIVDENSPNKLVVSSFKLSPSTMSIVLDSDEGSSLVVDATYSILNFKAEGTYKLNVKKLSNYKELTSIELEGTLIGVGEFKVDEEMANIDGVVNVADAMIDYDINLKDHTFKKAVIKSESIKIEEILKLFAQPAVATGTIKLDSDITPDSNNKLKGVATILIDSGLAYKNQLKKAYNIEVPKDVDFKGKIEADVDGSDILINSNITSSLLKLNTENIELDLENRSASGDIRAEVNPIKTELFTVKDHINLVANLKSNSSITDIAAVTDMFGSSIKASVKLDRFEPKKVVANSDLIKIENILEFFNQPAYSSGDLLARVDMDIKSSSNIKGLLDFKIEKGLLYKSTLQNELNTTIPKNINYSSETTANFEGELIKATSKIDSELLSLYLSNIIYHQDQKSFDGNFEAKLEPIQTPYADINETLNIVGQATSDKSDTNIVANTEYFNSPINIKLLLEELSPKSASFTAPSLSLEEVLVFANQEPFATGKLDVDAHIEGLDSKKPKGTLSSTGSSLLITKQSLKEFFKIENPDKNIEGNLNLDLNITDGIAKSSVDLATNVANVKTKNLTYDMEKESLQTEFDIDIDDLKSLEFLIGTALYGGIKIKNSLALNDDKIKYTAHSDTLDGVVDVDFDDYVVNISAKNIDAYKLDELLGLKKVFKSGAFNLESKLMLDKNSEDMIATLNGDVALRGKSLILEGYNIDTIVNNFKNTQSITLLDVGAIVIAGPIGIAATKGVSASGMAFGSSGGDTLIQDLVVKSTIENGLAKADDVAFSTKSNLVAANGGIQLWNQEFKSFWIAVVNKYGCSEYKQRVGGTISDPKIMATQSSFEIVKNVAKSVGSIFTDSADALGGVLGMKEIASDCDKFYRGEVSFPK